MLHAIFGILYKKKLFTWNSNLTECPWYYLVTPPVQLREAYKGHLLGEHVLKFLTKNQTEFLGPDSMYLASQDPLRQRKKESFYLEKRKETNNGTETTSWRVCQSGMAKASPPRIICPTQAVQTATVIPMAWHRGTVHSTPGRKHEQDFDFKVGTSKSKSRLGKCQRCKVFTYTA